MTIYEKMSLPTVAKIDRVVAKKQFYDNAELTSADKKLFDYVEKIYWRYALKTESTYVQPFTDEERDYPEIEVLEVVLREARRLERLAEIIMRAIPYPMLLFLVSDEKVQLWLGKLRQSEADKSRLIIEETEQTDWIGLEDAFWEAMSLKKMPTTNFAMLYEAWFDAVSKSKLANVGIVAEKVSGDKARETLDRLNAIDKEMTSLRSQMKKESQFNRKMELNMRLQRLKKERANMIEQGSVEA